MQETRVFDEGEFVRHCHIFSDMTTNTRSFLREFSSYKAKARRGEIVRVKDKEGEFLFTAAAPKKSLLGAGKGKLRVLADLTQPTLSNDNWRPSIG